VTVHFKRILLRNLKDTLLVERDGIQDPDNIYLKPITMFKYGNVEILLSDI
jgi:hypothetical protein